MATTTPLSVLLERLGELGARDRQIIERVALEGMAPDEFGALYGVERTAAVQLAWRAFARLQATPDSAAEHAFAAGWVEGEPVGDLATLRHSAEETRAHLVARDRARAASKWRQVEEWLRWVAIVAIVGLAAWSWFKDREQPPPEPRIPRTR